MRNCIRLLGRVMACVLYVWVHSARAAEDRRHRCEAMCGRIQKENGFNDPMVRRMGQEFKKCVEDPLTKYSECENRSLAVCVEPCTRGKEDLAPPVSTGPGSQFMLSPRGREIFNKVKLLVAELVAMDARRPEAVERYQRDAADALPRLERAKRNQDLGTMLQLCAQIVPEASDLVSSERRYIESEQSVVRLRDELRNLPERDAKRAADEMGQFVTVVRGDLPHRRSVVAEGQENLNKIQRGCSGMQKLTQSAPVIVTDFAIKDAEYGTRAVTGLVKNNSGKPLAFVNVQFGLYDRKGTLVGTTLANATHLGVDETWRFQAPIIDAGAAEARLTNVVAY